MSRCISKSEGLQRWSLCLCGARAVCCQPALLENPFIQVYSCFFIKGSCSFHGWKLRQILLCLRVCFLELFSQNPQGCRETTSSNKENHPNVF